MKRYFLKKDFLILSLVSFLQDEFSIEIDGDDLSESNFESINTIAAFIETKIQ